MSSKIQKQKKIFTLLNSKFSSLAEESASHVSQILEDEPENSLKNSQYRLIDKVYNFYKSIIQNINGGLITLDLEGEITFVNRIAAQKLGYLINELLGKNISDLFGEDDDSQKILRMLFVPGKRIDEKEVSFLQKDGGRIIVGLTTSPIHDEDNQFDGIVLLFRDVTEVSHLKLQIERMERLALLGELSAGIAHEIRNPLAGIKAAAQVLEETFAEEDKRVQIVERIVREVDKANRLLTEFFKFARPTKPKLNFYDLDMIIDGVYLLLAPKMLKRNIEFSTGFGKGVPRAYIDETQLEQVFINIFLNAIDSMPKGGSLKIVTSAKKFHVLDNEKEKLAVNNNELNYALVEISDTGIGISRDNLEKIFNPFFTSKAEGLGLGLSICSRLIEENGGKIDVVSEEGKGTTFILALPAFIHK
ncbi:MAG: ATP-binding protein [Calditrichia bacterium]